MRHTLWQLGCVLSNSGQVTILGTVTPGQPSWIHALQTTLGVAMQAVHEMAIQAGDKVAEGRALWQLGSVLSDQGQYKDAEGPLREALAILEAELGESHLDVARACNGETW